MCVSIWETSVNFTINLISTTLLLPLGVLNLSGGKMKDLLPYWSQTMTHIVHQEKESPLIKEYQLQFPYGPFIVSPLTDEKMFCSQIASVFQTFVGVST